MKHSSTFRVAAFPAALALLAAALGCGGSDDAVPRPPEPTYEAIGPFSEGRAAVKQAGTWGYIDKSGRVVIPPRYQRALPFSEGLAAVRRGSRWEIVDRHGSTVTAGVPLLRLGRFSGGLAPARSSMRLPWGYVDTSGRLAIPARFRTADAFSSGGLAPVLKDGRWSYIRPDGSVAFETDFFRAFPFSEDGLALVLAEFGGWYGYIDENSQLVVPARFAEARAFSDGLAAVREGDAWGYISPSGDYAIEPGYESALPFSGGIGLVREGGKYHYIDATGARLFPESFARAEPFSDGAAVVGDGHRSWFIDSSGKPLGIGTAVSLPSSSPSAQCATGQYQAVQTSYAGGLVQFRVINLTDMEWSLSKTDTWTGGGSIPSVLGTPTSVGPSAISSFFVKYPSMAESDASSGTYPVTNLTLAASDAAGDYTITLANTNNYTQPPPPPSVPWWDFLFGFADLIEGVVDFETNPFWALYDLVEGTVDLISGVSEGNQGSGNQNASTQNMLSTEIAAELNGGAFEPLAGARCGGDSFTIADAGTVVLELTTAKTQSSPMEVHLYIHPYAEYFAVNALDLLNNFRQGDNGTNSQDPVFGCVYQVAFENWSDLQDNNECHAPPAFPDYDYMQTASAFSPDEALDWWMFANELPTQPAGSIAQWIARFPGYCGQGTPNCPPVMSLPQTSFAGEGKGEGCTWTVQVQNPYGPLTFDPAEEITVSSNTCNPSTSATYPIASCQFDVNVATGTSSLTFDTTDGYSTVPVTLSCAAAPSMSLPVDTFSDPGATDDCGFTVTVDNTWGPLTLDPSEWVDDNECTEAADTCTFELGVPLGMIGQAVTLSDTYTTASLTVSCGRPPMSLPVTTFSGSSSTDCSFTVQVLNPAAAVTLDPALATTGNTCTAAADSCSFTVGVPEGTASEQVIVSDGVTSVPITLTCEAASMSLPVTTFSGTSSTTCPFDVAVLNAWGAVTLDPALPTTGNTCTGAAASCGFTVSVPVGTASEQVAVSDGQTSVPISLTCTNAPMTLSQTSFTGEAFPGQVACSFDATAYNTAGAVSLGAHDASISIGSSWCTGPAASCDLQFTVLVGASGAGATVTDGVTPVGITATCNRP